MEALKIKRENLKKAGSLSVILIVLYWATSTFKQTENTQSLSELKQDLYGAFWMFL